MNVNEVMSIERPSKLVKDDMATKGMFAEVLTDRDLQHNLSIKFTLPRHQAPLSLWEGAGPGWRGSAKEKCGK